MIDEPEIPPVTERIDRPKFLSKVRFDSFDLPTEVLSGLDDAGFTLCSPIQAEVFPLSLSGRDVAGQAQTGTGKTAAFLVTIFTRLLAMTDRTPGLPSALIVAPTRELALQIFEEAELLGRHTGLTFAQVVGGIDYQKQANVLRHGADIVICTPGRIIDYLKQGIFKASGIKIVVIDECDRLFDLGFTNDMRYILRRLPHYEQRQSMLFSATLSYRVLELTYEYMNLPEFISVTPEDVAVAGIRQSLFHVGRAEKLPLLLGLLDREEFTRALIFVNTKAGVEWLAKKLQGNGWPAEAITGDLPQRKRFQLMEQFKEGKIRILVATDVASRGIHVEDITHVINYDLPQDAENYVHRIGRTARAGKTGTAISMACEDYVYHLEPLEELLGYQIPVAWPENDWFKEDQAGPVTSDWRRRNDRDRKPSGSRPSRSRPGNAQKSEPRSEKRSEPRKPRETEKPRPRPKPKSKAITRPGGIFGLVPHTKPAPEIEPEPPKDTCEDPAKKKKRRRRRKKPKSVENSGASPSNGQED